MLYKNKGDVERVNNKEEEELHLSGVELMIAFTGYYFYKLYKEGKFDDIIKDVEKRKSLEEGTFSKQKLANQKMEERKGYHLNTATYELEEVEQ